MSTYNFINGFLVVEKDSEEWHYMWGKLAEQEENKEDKKPTVCMYYGERWQYMGTSVNGKTLKHSFRHRMHPRFNGSRHYINIDASEKFNSEYVKQKESRRKFEENWRYWRNGGPNGPTGHGPDICYSDADCGL
jgi:hypothetical protein